MSNENRISIKQPQLLHIDCGNKISMGANQDWYSTWMRRISGCGPTAASNIFWYLSATRPETCGKLFDEDCRQLESMKRLMEWVFFFVKPGIKGLNKPSMMVSGVERFSAQQGSPLRCRVLEVPKAEKDRPSKEKVLEFIKSGLAADLPVAFLNLHCGSLKNLDTWHWVTLVSVDDELKAEMYDDSKSVIIDIAQWLPSTINGGAFVIIEPK